MFSNGNGFINAYYRDFIKLMPYIFVDLTNDVIGKTRLTRILLQHDKKVCAFIVNKRRPVSGQDMLMFRKELLDLGLEWGRDFYVKEMGGPE